MGDAQRYRINHLIAAGGMAEVYLGESSGIEGFRKKVAIKRVLPKLSENQEFINMFLDEARLGAYLNHSKCVQVFDIGEGAGTHFIVMEYVDGADLKGMLDFLAKQKKLMSVEVACLIAMQICEGLAYAHQASDHDGNPLHIVHRDISPHNVLMTRFGEVKLVDFGLAKASSHLEAEDEDIVKGKFGYLAPEVALRQGVDHRVDIFAAGILLFEMLAGRRLFLGETDLETFKQVQAAQIPDLRRSRPDVDDAMMRVVLRALARDRDERYQTANEFATDLSRVLFDRSHPVTYQDIAAAVAATAAAQTKAQQKVRRSNTEAVIGELIIEALHGFSRDEEFEDEDEERQAGERTSAHAPLAVSHATDSFEDPSAWGLGDELGDLLERPAQPKLPSRRPPPPRKSSIPPRQRSLPPPRERMQPPAAEESASGAWWRRWFG